MTVCDLMTSDVEACRPDTDLAAVAKMMRDRDCGLMPLVDAAGTFGGDVADRATCIASTTRRLLPEYMSAEA